MSIFPLDKAIKLFPTDLFKKWQRYLRKTQSLLSLWLMVFLAPKPQLTSILFFGVIPRMVKHIVHWLIEIAEESILFRTKHRETFFCSIGGKQMHWICHNELLELCSILHLWLCVDPKGIIACVQASLLLKRPIMASKPGTYAIHGPKTKVSVSP